MGHEINAEKEETENMKTNCRSFQKMCADGADAVDRLHSLHTHTHSHTVGGAGVLRGKHGLVAGCSDKQKRKEEVHHTPDFVL